MESSSSDDRGAPDDSAQIELQVLSVEPAKAGRLEALAVAGMALDGVPVERHGVRVVRRPDGTFHVEPPTYRAPGGSWRPAVVLPEALAKGIGDVVFEAFASENCK